MFRVPRNPCRFIPLVSNGYYEKESQRRTSAQIRCRTTQGTARRQDGLSRLLHPARQGTGGGSDMDRVRPDGALKERRPPAAHDRTDDPAAAACRHGQQPQSARPKSQLHRICSGSGGVHGINRKDRYAHRSNQ